MERKDEQHTQHCKYSPLAWRDRGYAIKENYENYTFNFKTEMKMSQNSLFGITP